MMRLRMSPPRLLRTTLLNRLSLDTGIRLEAGYDLHVDLAFDQTLYIGQQLAFVDAHEGNGVTFTAGPRRAPNSMHVIARNVRQLEVDDMW